LVNLPKLVFDPVYLNGIHALRRFEIRNLSSFPLIVKLRSNLGAQISFQLTNENLPDDDLQADNSKTVFKMGSWSGSAPQSLRSSLNSIVGYSQTEFQSSTVDGESGAWSLSRSSSMENNVPPLPPVANARDQSGQKEHGHQFNQLFNYVNHIDQVYLPAGQSEKVIVAFLPAEKSHDDVSNKAEEIENPFPTADGEESNDFFEVNGVIFFFAFKVVADKDDVRSVTKHFIEGLETPGSDVSLQSRIQASDSVGPGDATDPDAKNTAAPDYQVLPTDLDVNQIKVKSVPISLMDRYRLRRDYFRRLRCRRDVLQGLHYLEQIRNRAALDIKHCGFVERDQQKLARVYRLRYG
jgi:hypothetical protein